MDKFKARLMFPCGEDLSKAIASTLGTMDKIIGATLGPGGRPILIDRMAMPVLITKDGVTVSEFMVFDDALQYTISEAAKEVCQKTNTEAGDGPQPLYSKVLTPRGFIAMGDVKVGMSVCGTNGTTQQILGVFPKGSKEIYEVKFLDGKVVKCCKDHLWHVTTNYGTTKICPTGELLKDYVSFDSDDYPRYKYFVPKTTVEFDQIDCEMPLDPYLTGLLIGDGTLRTSGSIELWFGKNKEHAIKKMVLPKGITANVTFVENKNCFRIKLNGKNENGQTMHRIIESIGLLDTKSETKFIPKQYLYSSRAFREKLLQGLLDTDGHINVRNRFEFSTVSNQLAKDFIELTRSLGISVCLNKRERKPGCDSYSMKPIYRITELKGYQYGDKIIDIQPTGEFTEMQCIKVSNVDNLYITDNYVVTHNTTTAIVLAKALVEEGVKFLLNNPQKSPQELCRELATSLDTVTEWLKTMAIPVESSTIKEVAMVSSNFDQEIADVVTKAIDMVGEDGTIITVEGSGKGITVELTDGFPIAKGLSELGPIHEVFINNPADQECQYADPYILLFDGDLLVPTVLINFIATAITQMNKENSARPIVIIAHNFSPEVIKLFATSVKMNGMYICPLMTAGTAQPLSKHHLLNDIAALTGAEVMDGFNNTFQKVLQMIQKDSSLNILDIMGSCTQAKIGRYKSVLLGFQGTEDLIEERIKTLKVQMENAESDFDAELIKERIAQLSGGIATISVNAASDVEIKEKKHRVEDTIHAIRSAIEMGVVAGGGAAQLAISDKIRTVAGIDPTMPMSSLILSKALMVPFERIMANAGCSQETINKAIIDTIASIDPITLRSNIIYNSLTHKSANPMKDGIIDPVKVTITALKNAVSVSALLMTLGGALVLPREKEPKEKIQEDSLDQN